MVVNIVVCCLVCGLSWPCFVLPDIASAWESVFRFSSTRSVCLLLSWLRCRTFLQGEQLLSSAGELLGVLMEGGVGILRRDAGKVGERKTGIL